MNQILIHSLNNIAIKSWKFNKNIKKKVTFLLKGDLKRNLFWLAFEQTALKMAKELELEI